MNTSLLVLQQKFLLELTLLVFKTFHSVPSVGYGFWQIKSKLKEEYKDLKGPQIAELRKKGVSVVEDTELPLFVFTGDTSIKLYETNTDIFTFPVIITGKIVSFFTNTYCLECTYLYENEIELAAKNDHICWAQLKPYVEMHPKVTFILTHFSMKYGDKEILEFFSKVTLPNIVVWTDLHPIKSST